MAHKKAGGSTALGRDSRSKRLGVKVFGGQNIKSGQIILRQRGTKWHPGLNVRRGSDDTLYAATGGIVKFYKKKIKKFTGNLKLTRFIAINQK